MTKEQYKVLRSKLNFKYRYRFLFSEIAIDAFLLITAYSLITQNSFLSFLSSLPIALIMIRNVSVMHEAVHGLLHPNSYINYALGIISGSLCLLPFHLWKKIHMEHHFWAGNYHKDPSLEIMKRYPTASPILKAVLNFSWKTRIPLTAFAQYIVFWGHSFAQALKKPKEGLLWVNLIVPFAIWGTVIVSMNATQMASLSLGVFIYLLAFEAINFPHHVGLYLEGSETAKRPVWQQYEITRTSKYNSLVERLTVLNFNYHAEHHIFPDLPWHELPHAHQLIQGSEIGAKTTVIEAGWLKEQRRMPFSQYLRPDLVTKDLDKDAA